MNFALNTFSFLIWGVLVMWMCAGFTMLESGSVRTKNASVICLKNIGLYAIAGLAYYAVGYNLMYVDVTSWIGSFTFFYGPSAQEIALLKGDTSVAEAVAETGHAVMSAWFFQMVFVTSAASIVSGTLGERVKLWSFFLFTLTADRVHLSRDRRLDVGRRLAQSDGVPGLCRLDRRAFHRRVGGTGWCYCSRATTQEVPGRRYRQGDTPFKRPRGSPWCVHPLAGLVRLQLRLATGARRGERCRGHEHHPGEYESGGGGRGDGGDLRVQTHFGQV